MAARTSGPSSGDIARTGTHLMRLGLVSNVFRRQLADGEPLESLIAKALHLGCDVIELRQGSLGTYESDAHLPYIDALARLASNFPDVRFIPAMEVAFLDLATAPADTAFRAGRALARAVAGDEPPHLRLVDIATPASMLEGADLSAIAGVLHLLTMAMAEVGGILSVENASQPWSRLSGVVDLARVGLGADGHRLKYCFDPCNMSWLAGDRTTAAEAMASLTPEQVGMVHFKQRIDGSIDPLVRPGGVIWADLITVMGRRRLFGQSLFEMAPHEDLWDNLARSSAYLRGMWAELVAGEPWGRSPSTDR
jgi:sugar phosphate isomerase/epimerase